MRNWHTKVLAIVFIFSIFYISVDSLPPLIIKIADHIKDTEAEGAGIKASIDELYQNMLTFGGDYLRNKGQYINLNGLMARGIGQRYMNGAVKLNNGQLTYHETAERDIARAVKQMVKLNKSQKSIGKHFLFVMAPYKVSKYEDLLPSWFIDNANMNADTFIAELTEQGVPVLDLRYEMFSDGLTSKDVFFDTDHHWRSESGFWAYTKIADYLLDNGILNEVDPFYLDTENFNINVFENWFLGSLGKRTGSHFAGVDDFSIITPKFETSFSQIGRPVNELYISNDMIAGDAVKKGSWEDAVLSVEGNTKNYFTDSPYDRVFSINGKIINNAPQNDLKILALVDSFGLTSVSYLPLIASELNVARMRDEITDFEMYYSETPPDIILILVNADNSYEVNLF